MKFNTYLKLTKKLVYQNYFEKLNFPLEVFIELTNKCNSNCRYCYKKDVLAKSKGEIDAQLFYKIVDEIKYNSKSLVILEGGEPFMHSSIFSFLKYLSENNIYTDIITNGRFFNTKNIDKLREFYNDELFQIQISLDDVGMLNSNNRLYNSDEVVNGIKRLNGIGISPRIHTVATKNNIMHLTDFANYLNENVKIKSLTICAVFGSSNDILKPLECDVIRFQEQLNSCLNNFNFDISLSLNRKKYKCDEINYTNNSYGILRCTAMRSKVCINHEGYVYPCVFFENKSIPMGNVKNEYLVDIWNKTEVDNFRNRLQERDIKCLTCKHSKECIQNCKADF